MKILIDARSMGTKPSGIGMYIYNFAKELVKEPDMEIHLLSDVATSNEMRMEQSAGSHTSLLRYTGRKKILGWLNIIAICKSDP